MSDKIEVFSRSLEGGSRTLRPINGQILVEAEPTSRTYGKIIAVSGPMTADVYISKVLAVAPKAKAFTVRGKVKAGDRVLSVRVVNKTVDDIDLRLEQGQKVSFLPDEHCLAVLEEEHILPCNDLLLVEGQGDRRQYGKITLIGGDTLEVVSCKILATGPDVTQGEVGEFAISPLRFGVTIDSIEVRRKFGGNLKLLREKSVTGVGSAPVEGQAYPEVIPEQKNHRIV